MATPRAYIPSTALIRALSRPLAPRCPLVRCQPVHCVRYKRTKSHADPERVQDAQAKSELRRSRVGWKAEEAAFVDRIGNGLEIEFYEQDIDQKKPKVLVDKIATQEDVARHRREQQEWEELLRNPHQNRNELLRQTYDALMQNPSFADVRGVLEYMKAGIMSKEEEARVEAEVDKDIPAELREMDAQLTMAMHEHVQELIDDPEMAGARKELVEFQHSIPGWHKARPDVQHAMARLNEKLEQIPAYQRKMAALKEEEERNGEDPNTLGAQIDEFLASEELVEEEELDLDQLDAFDDKEFLDTLLQDMQGVAAAMGDNEIAKQLQSVLDENPTAEAEREAEEGVDLNKLAEQIIELKDNPPSEAAADEGEEKVDSRLEALVDMIMEDPKLIEKLALVKRVLAEAKGDLTTLASPCAPDPDTLDDSKLTTYRERLRVAENDPEHLAGIRRLRINLLPPFNVSPALKALNKSLQYAYLGASDDVRRILWRSYIKARTVPTLLRNIPDDAWDLLWYSQAVTWKSNQNRKTHLEILLHDLNNVGREGPPTHPDTIAAEQ